LELESEGFLHQTLLMAFPVKILEQSKVKKNLAMVSPII